MEKYVHENNIIELFNKYPGKTCFILKNDEIVFTSDCRGVKPLMEYYMEFGEDSGPLTVADKIMGKGAVVLSILIGAEKIVTPVISEAAYKLAELYNVESYFINKVPFINNRAGDGQCPIEKAVNEISDIRKGYMIIKATLAQLSGE